MSGSTMVRVCTAAICVRKMSMPSRKKGRFSSKKIGKRWLAVLTVASASTCAKSGLTARPSVAAEDMTSFAVRPGSNPTGLLTKRPLSVGTLKDRKSTRLNSSHANISYAVFCLQEPKPIELPKQLHKCPAHQQTRQHEHAITMCLNTEHLCTT